MVDVGSNAPDFTLLEAPGKSITLSGELEKGSVVLLFYPGDFTSVCTEEMCFFRDELADYNDLGANVIGISVDGIFSHAAFKERNGIQFPLLSDWEKTVIRSYDVVHPDLAGMKEVAKRAVFVIGVDGKVSYKWVGDSLGDLPPFDEVKKAVQDLT
ncbi:MAG: redoxin domain-containing protein [Candidatus Thorarchaeota archaeon]|jgi:peroxiredoxin